MIFYIYNIDSGQQINSMDIHNQSKLLNKYMNQMILTLKNNKKSKKSLKTWILHFHFITITIAQLSISTT